MERARTTEIKQFMIGERNIKLAYEMLKDYSIPVVSASVGGKYGRKIQYNTHTGEVKQKFILKSTENITKP